MGVRLPIMGVPLPYKDIGHVILDWPSFFIIIRDDIQIYQHSELYVALVGWTQKNYHKVYSLPYKVYSLPYKGILTTSPILKNLGFTMWTTALRSKTIREIIREI